MNGENRDLFAVFLFTILTLGIYWLYWYYKVNDETRRHSVHIDVAPGLAVLCQFIPIVNFVSKYNTAERVLRLQTECDEPGRIAPLAAVLFAIFVPIGIYTYMIQSHLNRHWQWHNRRLVQATPVEGQIVE